MERTGRTARIDRDQGGFTLGELLVVIVILGTLAGIVVTATRMLSDQATASSCAADARRIAQAQERYRAEHAGAAGAEADLVAGGYLRSESTLHDVTVDGSTYDVVATLRCADEVAAGAETGPLLLASFDAPDGTALGATDGAWAVTRGRWQVAGGEARASSTSYGTATLDAGTAHVTATVALAFAPADKVNAGLFVAGNGADGFSVALTKGKGTKAKTRVELRRHEGRRHTRVQRVTLPAVPDAPATMAASVDDGLLVVRVGGVEATRYSLSAAEQATFGADTRVGLYAHRDPRTGFDDFRVDPA